MLVPKRQMQYAWLLDVHQCEYWRKQFGVSYQNPMLLHQVVQLIQYAAQLEQSSAAWNLRAVHPQEHLFVVDPIVDQTALRHTKSLAQWLEQRPNECTWVQALSAKINPRALKGQSAQEHVFWIYQTCASWLDQMHTAEQLECVIKAVRYCGSVQSWIDQKAQQLGVEMRALKTIQQQGIYDQILKTGTIHVQWIDVAARSIAQMQLHLQALSNGKNYPLMWSPKMISTVEALSEEPGFCGALLKYWNRALSEVPLELVQTSDLCSLGVVLQGQRWESVLKQYARREKSMSAQLRWLCGSWSSAHERRTMEDALAVNTRSMGALSASSVRL